MVVAFLGISMPAFAKPTVQPVWGNIAEEWFQNEIIFRGLEKMGYEVKTPLEVEITVAHVAVGNGDADFYAVHWDPLQTAFYEKGGGDKTMTKVGTIASGALQGYLIDKATADKYKITSVDQLKDPKIAKLFDTNNDGKADLTGCNPGWGCERVIEHHLKAYDLAGTVKHNQGSYFALMANTITKHKNGEPILYYTWTPLWVSGILVPGENVQWLTVPRTDLPGGEEGANTLLPDGRNVGFSVNNIRILANNKFLAKNPAAKKFFEMVQIPINDISAENLMMNKGEDSMKDIRRHANDWIKANQSTFDKWVAEAKKLM
ncbi:MAG: glycine betaine/L-proline ABC transporter substrate-binding protein ProX [bacterium]|nr:glycine betaine/L-proline ABC transporter substrate-binding protein ProX [bacterium]